MSTADMLADEFISIPYHFFLAMMDQFLWHFNLLLFLKHKLWRPQSYSSSEKFIMVIFQYTERS
jgi:hypothetical protein